MLFFFGGFRILFGIIGLIFSLMPLILFVIFIRFIYKSITKNNRINEYLHTQPPAHNQFIELFARAAAHIIIVDGKIEEVEIQTFKNFFVIAFNYRGVQLDWVEDILKAELKQRHAITDIANEINIKLNYDVKLVLLDLLYQIAFSDFEFHVSEQKFIEKLAGLLNISEGDHDVIKSRYLKSAGDYQDNDQYYKVLGLSSGATKEEIKVAYRTLVKRFHPDVVAHLGPEMKEYNEKKMNEIIKAYKALI